MERLPNDRIREHDKSCDLCWVLICRHDRASRCQKNTQRNEKATPFGIDFMRSKVLYQAAQGQV